MRGENWRGKCMKTTDVHLRDEDFRSEDCACITAEMQKLNCAKDPCSTSRPCSYASADVVCILTYSISRNLSVYSVPLWWICIFCISPQQQHVGEVSWRST